jgi:glycosyltransferase involved in cell wall biosynthesis
VKIIIFGTGNYYRLSKKYINNNDIFCFIDNDINKENAYLDGKIIKRPEDVNFDECDYVLILIMRYKKILEQLLEIGVKREKIKLYTDLDDLYRIDPIIYSEGYKYDFKGWMEEKQEKKVMLICHELTRNGVSVVLMHVAMMLKKMGYRVLMSALLEGELQEELKENNIDYISQINMLYGGQRFADLVKDMEFVIVGTIGIADVARRIARTDIPIVWWIHESNDKDFNDFPIVMRDNVHYYAGGKRVVKCFKKHYSHVQIDKLLYYLPDDSHDKIMERDVFRIGIIGLIYPRKAQDIFVKAIEKIPAEKKKDVSFEIVGKYIEPIIDMDKVLKHNPQIKYIEEMSQQDLKDYFTKLDLLVCPSRDDPMPVVVTQAMQNGIPCIVSDQVGQEEYIADGINGFVFMSENIDELAEKIEYCLDNRDELYDVGKKSRKIYYDYFSEYAMQQNLQRIIDSI